MINTESKYGVLDDVKLLILQKVFKKKIDAQILKEICEYEISRNLSVEDIEMKNRMLIGMYRNIMIVLDMTKQLYNQGVSLEKCAELLEGCIYATTLVFDNIKKYAYENNFKLELSLVCFIPNTKN